ncbi:MAG: hypothetical protein QOF30_1698 [Acidimicrobiaceae bacterium]|jgi:hypothetical protein|nr:hypothetical protein [Acidimicrobiaceae bacterium]
MVGMELYAAAPPAVDIADCIFYHVMDLPGYGTTSGEWDLRGHEAEYLGQVPLAGKRVLEIGPASGHLTFWMEQQGADVVAYDLGPDDQSDLLLYAHTDRQAMAQRQFARRNLVANGWWFAHRAFGSRARRAHGTVYQIPAELGPFEVTTVSAVLLHLRDPFGALQRALDLTTETVIITEPAGSGASWWRRLLRRYSAAHINFLPDARTGQPDDGWWGLNPEVVQRMLAVLGFSQSTVSYHSQRYIRDNKDMANFTVVAHRVPA